MRLHAFVVTVAAVALACAACSEPATQEGRGPSAAAPSDERSGTHLAPDLEARLPDELRAVPLTTASTVGEAVFADDAWSQEMTEFLAGVDRTRSDLRFAQVWDPSSELDLDAGVFQLPGIPATEVRQALVDSARPNAPGLTDATETVGDKSVTAVVYPGDGPTLYLYEQDDAVFYIGTRDDDLALEFLAELP
ncbi:MAG: hypothetical protein ACRDVN_13165 [Jiangellaceae bacterium]